MSTIADGGGGSDQDLGAGRLARVAWARCEAGERSGGGGSRGRGKEAGG